MNAPVNDGPRTLLEKLMAGTEPVRIAAPPVVRVIEVVGFVDVDALAGMAIEDSATGRGVYMSDILPEGVEGKRGRYVVTVSFEEET